VFVNVVDGVCFQLRQSTSKVNHRNMVAIFNIIKSMENGDIPVAYRQRRRSTRQSYLCKNILGSFDAPTSTRVVVGQRYLDGTLSSTSTNTGTKIL